MSETVVVIITVIGSVLAVLIGFSHGVRDRVGSKELENQEGDEHPSE